MKKTILGVAMLATLAMPIAHAQGYVEGHVVTTRISGDHGLSSNPNPSIFLGIAGYDLHPNLAIEGALGFNLTKDSATATSGGSTFEVDTKIKSMYGLYIKPHYHFNEAFEVFARIGHMRTKLDLSAPANAPFASGSHSNGSTAWALGVNYAFDKNSYFSVGYNRFSHSDGITIKGLNLGLGYRF